MSGNDVKTIERKINSDLRKAQNNMFNGKNEEAMNMIKEMWTDIEQIRSIDQSYRGITMLEQKYEKLKRDLEKN